MSIYETYLELLGDLSQTLSALSRTAAEKAEAVRGDDLAALDAVIKQEQALSLALRGQEQKRARLLRELGLEHSRLTDLVRLCPEEYRLRAKAAAEELQLQYQLYCSAAGVARNVLERNLHQIEQFLSRSGQTPAVGPGYAQHTVPDAAPSPMRTDLHA